MKFDIVVANPPFSLDKWGAEHAAATSTSGSGAAFRPSRRATTAFITHMIEIARRQSGRVAVIVPHGVLFRGGSEGKIRQALIEENLLDAVVGLPANLFTTTGIPVAILVFDRSREQGGANENRKDILFIDASREFTPSKTQNLMTDAHIQKVLDTYRTRAELDKYSHRATPEEITGERVQPQHPPLRGHLRAGRRDRRGRAAERDQPPRRRTGRGPRPHGRATSRSWASMSNGELILYTSEDGAARIQLRAEGGTVWLSLNQIADLFGRDKSVISRHIKAIFDDGELAADSVVARYATTAADGKTYQVDYYNLEMILAVGYRVRSPRGVEFRRWASTTLKEYLVKGFVLDDKRLKDPAWDYFDELLERIREIRASEARFYQKVREILALSEDYDPRAQSAQVFYATIQNKMLHAVTGHTAAELIAARANASLPNMGLTAWKGARVRKSDVTTAKNYLAEKEISELNLIVTMFLDTADLRARRRQTMKLTDWEVVLDGFLRSNELPLLTNAGSVSAAQAERIAFERYENFDAQRREQLAAGEPSEIVS